MEQAWRDYTDQMNDVQKFNFNIKDVQSAFRAGWYRCMEYIIRKEVRKLNE
jgi:hypothetical protein